MLKNNIRAKLSLFYSHFLIPVTYNSTLLILYLYTADYYTVSVLLAFLLLYYLLSYIYTKENKNVDDIEKIIKMEIEKENTKEIIQEKERKTTKK